MRPSIYALAWLSTMLLSACASQPVPAKCPPFPDLPKAMQEPPANLELVPLEMRP